MLATSGSHISLRILRQQSDCRGGFDADLALCAAGPPTQHFTLMVVGESGLGKTTLVNTLFSTELAQAKNYRQRFSRQLDRTTEVDVIKAEASRSFALSFV